MWGDVQSVLRIPTFQVLILQVRGVPPGPCLPLPRWHRM